MDEPVSFNELLWNCDYAGDEVGYDDVETVGYYSWVDKNVDLYIDTETNEVLEMWKTEDEE